MIMRSIQVEGWRCFAASVHVGPFGDGLNIIHGPNGIGKSTLMLALVRGLFDSHNVGGVEIKTLRPWGRDLTPKVTIEFEQGGDQYQLHKQFLDSALAKLARKEDGRFVPIAESRAADERAREILAGETSLRGASDQRHWGLAQILWAAQGSLKIDQLADGTRATIQNALGDQLAGPGTDGLEKRIAENFRQFFTTTGRLRSGASQPAIVGLESQLASAQSERAKYQQRLQDFEDASRRIQDLRRQTETARDQELELAASLTKTREEAMDYQSFVGQQKQHQLEMSAADERYRSLSGRIKSIQAADDELNSIANKLTQLRDDWPVQEKLVEGQQAEAKNAEESLREIRGKRSDVAAIRQLAQTAERYIRNQHKCLELEKQWKQIEMAGNELDSFRQERATIVAPDKKALKKIIQIARQRDDSRLKLDAALVTVKIQLESDLQIEIAQAEVVGTKSFARNDSVEFKGTPDVGFRIPGIGQFRATGPTGDFEELHREWELAKNTLVELTGGYGTCDIAALEALHAQADGLEQQISQAEIKLSTLLDGGTVDRFRAEHFRTRNTLDEFHRNYSEWKQLPPVEADLSRQADEAENHVVSEIVKAELAADQTQKSLHRELRKFENLKSEIANLESRIGALEAQLKPLRDDGLDDRLRGEKLTTIALERDVAQGKLAAVEKQIQELGPDPAKTLAILEAQQTAIHSAAQDAERKLSTESGRLDQIVSEAPYAALAAVEELIARLEEEIGRHRLEIDAIALLHHTVTLQKSDAMRDLIEPIRQRANIILQRIAGSRFDGVQFGETLLPTGIDPRGNDGAVALDQISGGEQEQVHFAVRMALADIAFPEGRQLVVLDDVFTYTDTSRLARIATLLDEAAERFQIVLLTCHPERYRGLPNAEFFDLESLAT